MTALIGSNLEPEFKWGKWGGDFIGVKDYLIEAFYKSLKEFRTSNSNEVLTNELSEMIEYCCFPYPDKRGHPKVFNQTANQYDLQRVISKLDLLFKKISFQFKQWQ
jgi:hypothetical protein